LDITFGTCNMFDTVHKYYTRQSTWTIECIHVYYFANKIVCLCNKLLKLLNY